MNKKGSLVDIVVWMVLAMVTIFVLGVLVYAFVTIETHLGDVGEVGGINISDITEQTFGQVTPAVQNWLPKIAVIILVMSAFSILVHNFLVKAHPAFFVTYFLMTFGAVIGSTYLSNAYMDTILVEETLGPTFQTFTGANFIMQWLPFWVAIVGIFGAIFLFMGILRDRGGGVQI